MSSRNKSRVLPGLNVQHPWAELLISGKKTVETRTYPIPEKYCEREIYVVETGGDDSSVSAKVVGIIRFGRSFRYQSEKEFYRDSVRHLVDQNSKFAWDSEKDKWGWPVLSVTRLKTPMPAPKGRGIVWSSRLSI